MRLIPFLLGLVLWMAMAVVMLLLLYGVIRLAVRHALHDHACREDDVIRRGLDDRDIDDRGLDD